MRIAWSAKALGAIKRAGADLIFTYFAMDLALAGI